MGGRQCNRKLSCPHDCKRYKMIKVTIPNKIVGRLISIFFKSPQQINLFVGEKYSFQ
jgi:hypothetical protein